MPLPAAINEEDVLAIASVRFDVDDASLRPIGHAGSCVYAFTRDDQDCVLRLLAGDSRSLDQLRGELDWIRYLKAGGICVSAPMRSIRNQLYETIEVNDVPVAAVAFRAAQGHPPVDFVDEWDDTFYQRWGELVGHMHTLTKGYHPPDEDSRRPRWFETEDVNLGAHIPASKTKVGQRCAQLVERLKTVPEHPDSFGLIHADLHRRNFFVNGDQFTVFDFEACQYSWFAYDIAVSLFHAVMKPPRHADRNDFAKHFMEQFMVGYSRFNDLDGVTLAHFLDFLRLRRVVMYIDMLRYWDLQHLSESRERFLSEYRHGIEDNTAVLNIDFS
ncbi:phosphotransferase enzyme family protein [Candidatus Eisenbacteria bacterium]|uniref:Phosphotransferase enzyme family protein n=1 Tax=Eiseniibacteriota bacterium TaxID=2212470 RepID=A0ABV6YJN2_UNCEI